MPNLIATTELRYAGINLHAGDSFDASEKDAKILKAIKKAKDYSAGSPNASDLPVEVMSRASKREPITEVEEMAAIVEEAPVVAKVLEPEEDEAPKAQRGVYQRRDMVAEPVKAKPLEPVKPLEAPRRRGPGRRGKAKKSQ